MHIQYTQNSALIILACLFQHPVAGQEVLAPCNLTGTLALTSGDGGGTQVTVDVGDVVFTISPATVRLVLGVLKPLQQDQV